MGDAPDKDVMDGSRERFGRVGDWRPVVRAVVSNGEWCLVALYLGNDDAECWLVDSGMGDCVLSEEPCTFRRVELESSLG